MKLRILSALIVSTFVAFTSAARPEATVLGTPDASVSTAACADGYTVKQCICLGGCLTSIPAKVYLTNCVASGTNVQAKAICIKTVEAIQEFNSVSCPAGCKMTKCVAMVAGAENEDAVNVNDNVAGNTCVKGSAPVEGFTWLRAYCEWNTAPIIGEKRGPSLDVLLDQAFKDTLYDYYSYFDTYYEENHPGYYEDGYAEERYGGEYGYEDSYYYGYDRYVAGNMAYGDNIENYDLQYYYY